MSNSYALVDATVATMASGAESYGLVERGCVVVDEGLIAWVGPFEEVPSQYDGIERRSCEGRLITPALIDCHTHIVHGGNRALEFEMRLNGASYEEVARAGGGIVSTVSATRGQSEAELLAAALVRADTLIAQGVSVVEVKSGYGLDHDTELKMLRVARKIAEQRPVRVVTSFLGAHAVPKGMEADTYIDTVCLSALEAAHAEGLVDAVDGFCEGIAFNTAQIERVFQKAAALGLPVKLHSDQLSNMGGTPLACQFGALSIDHVEYATNDDAMAMAQAGSTAVLLPGAFYTLHETRKPPIDAFREHGVPMAVGTDWNPGSSPLGSLLLAMNMACTLFGLTPAEALAGTTCHAARALGLKDCGMIAAGMRADLAVWNIQAPGELAYGIAINPLHTRIYNGILQP